MKSFLRRLIRPMIAILVIYLVFLIGPVASLDIPIIAGRIRENPDMLVQFLFIGLANGAIIAIIALGYTMVYGIVELINFAHGDVYMIGVFAALTTLSVTGTLTSNNPSHLVLGIVAALVVAVILCALLNMASERCAYWRLRKPPRL